MVLAAGDPQPVAVVAPVLIDVDDEPHEPAGRSGDYLA
jgi:hypothetical protein